MLLRRVFRADQRMECCGKHFAAGQAAAPWEARCGDRMPESSGRVRVVRAARAVNRECAGRAPGSRVLGGLEAPGTGRRPELGTVQGRRPE